ncbi:AT-hook motif nuclear-localized protein 5 [Ziziphus jujuba]|uniref:AT-hook motif nuclear-localized protein n=1 Tax=Ziziphus jujuba TaxID=326968 RepID=A0A6P4AGC0_ZIZJJ|nr:AT-hook motif nuclear-localized protein 5 [Ziziphus jujuba]
MDGREAMALSGSASYYIHRGGVGGSGSGSQSGGLHAPPGFRPLSNTGIPSQSNVRGGSLGSTFSVEPPRASFPHGIRMGSSPGMASGEPVKKKRGRPRKYGPDGPVSLRLSPMSAPPNLTQGSTTSSQKRSRGRPPGTGRKQQLAMLGDWMNSSAGIAFAPHVITVGVGEDIVAKLLSFAQQRPRALCILSGNGTVSSVSLRQPASTSVSVTYEGRFQILCLSGSYLVSEDGGPRSRTGGVSVSLSSPDGHVVGGGVAMLTAASPVQVVVCSFVYGNSKPKIKQITGHKSNESSETHHRSDKLTSPSSAPPTQNYTPSGSGIWPGSRAVDLRNPHTGIDLTRG